MCHVRKGSHLPGRRTPYLHNLGKAQLYTYRKMDCLWHLQIAKSRRLPLLAVTI